MSEKTCRICGKTFESNRVKACYCSFLCHKEGKRQISEEWARTHRKTKKPVKPIVITDPNAVRCTESVKKKCKYGAYNAGAWTCDYILKTGQRRGCPGEACTKYKADPDRHRGKPRAFTLKF